jgi:hypothetical protein
MSGWMLTHQCTMVEILSCQVEYSSIMQVLRCRDGHTSISVNASLTIALYLIFLLLINISN